MMEVIEQQRTSPLGQVKAQAEEEFLVKIGAKEEEVVWDPKITNERLRRSTSFICAEYHRPACYRLKPKLVAMCSPWSCDSQATRQLTLSSRFGPKKFYINNPNVHIIGESHLMGSKTQSLGLCFTPQTVDSL